jgi:SAM-dependent methyltransferase
MARALYGGGEFFYLSDIGNYDQAHNYQLQFRDHVLAEPALSGEILDIGCSGELPHFLRVFCARCRAMDGVDPDPVVMQNSRLRNRWNAPLEKAPIPDAQYDLAFAYTVLEHVSNPREFFTHVRRVLKPGGVFWFLTPHSRHLFTWLARGAELAGLKGGFHHHDPGVNEYSSYYRANSRHQILRAIHGLGFRTAQFFYHPSGWKQYFPPGLRWCGEVYDRLWAHCHLRAMLQFSCRLEVEG